MDWENRLKSKNPRIFLCSTFSLAFIFFIWMASANGVEIIASQSLSKSEISLSESSTITINLKGIGEPCIKPIDAVLAIDSTGSMATSDPSDIRKAVAKDFVNRMDFSKDRAAVVSWDTQAMAWSLANNSSEIVNEIDQVNSEGGTDLDVGLDSSIGLLANSRAIKVIIFLTDGEGIYTPTGMLGSQADLARSQGIMIFTIGLGQAAGEGYLKEIAQTTGGEYYPAPDASALADIYLNIYSKITGIAAENAYVNYVLPSTLVLDPGSYSQSPVSIKRQGDSTTLTWYVGSVFINQSRTISFDINSQDPGTFTVGTAPDTASDYVDCNAIPGSADISPVILTVKLPEPFSLAGSGVGGVNVSNELKVTKEILPNGKATCPDCPQVKITLEAPPKPCDIDILFALDKSGSMRDFDPNLKEKKFDVMRKQVLEFLRKPQLQNANIAIVSWADDDTAKSRRDLDTTLNPQWLKPGSSQINQVLQNYSEVSCLESDLTIYSEGISKAMNIMRDRIKADKDNPLKCNTKRFIVFITSWSEFRSSPLKDPEKLNRQLTQIESGSDSILYQDGFQGIFTFSVDFLQAGYPWEEYNLTGIARRTQGAYGGRFTAVNAWDEVQSKITGCDQGPWVTDVKLTDTLYPYLKFNSASTSPDNVKPNSDGSTTLVWNIGTLNRGRRWSTTIDTAIQMKLPVDVTKNLTRFGRDINPDTPYSRVEYVWPAETCGASPRKSYEMPIQEGKLWITCGAPCQVAKTVNISASSIDVTPGKTEASSKEKKQPGMGTWGAIVGLITMAYLLRRNE